MGGVAETLRHFAEGGHQQGEDVEGSKTGEDLQLYQVQVPQHEVQEDEERTRKSSEEDDRFRTHRAALPGLLQDDWQAHLLHAVQEVRQDPMRTEENQEGHPGEEDEKRLQPKRRVCKPKKRSCKPKKRSCKPKRKRCAPKK